MRPFPENFVLYYTYHNIGECEPVSNGPNPRVTHECFTTEEWECKGEKVEDDVRYPRSHHLRESVVSVRSGLERPGGGDI